MHRFLLFAAALLASARAQLPPAFQPGWIIAQRLNNSASGNAAQSGYLDVIDPVRKVVVYTYALPTSPSGSAAACTLASSKSEGSLSRAPDGSALYFSCYAAAPGDPSPETETTVGRVLAVLSADGSLDTSTVDTGVALLGDSQARGAFVNAATGLLHLAGGKAGLTAGQARGTVRAQAQQLLTSDGGSAAWCAGSGCRPNLRVAAPGWGGQLLIAASGVNASNASAPGGFGSGGGVFTLWPAGDALATPWPYAAAAFPPPIAAAPGPGAVPHTPVALDALSLAVGDEVFGVCLYARASPAAPYTLSGCDAGWQAALNLSLGSGADLGARHIGLENGTGTPLLYVAATLPLVKMEQPSCASNGFPCSNTLFRYDVVARSWTPIIAAPAGQVYRGVAGVPLAAPAPSPAPPAAAAATPLAAIIGGAVGGGVLLFAVGLVIGLYATGRLCPASMRLRQKAVTPASAARAQSLGAAAPQGEAVAAWPPTAAERAVANPLGAVNA